MTLTLPARISDLSKSLSGFFSARRRAVLRGVAFRENGAYVAVCLDPYLVTQAATEAELPSAILTMLETHLLACEELGCRPFEGLGKAPARYWRIWEDFKSSGRSIRQEPPKSVFPTFPRLELRTQGTA